MVDLDNARAWPRILHGRSLSLAEIRFAPFRFSACFDRSIPATELRSMPQAARVVKPPRVPPRYRPCPARLRSSWLDFTEHDLASSERLALSRRRYTRENPYRCSPSRIVVTLRVISPVRASASKIERKGRKGDAESVSVSFLPAKHGRPFNDVGSTPATRQRLADRLSRRNASVQKIATIRLETSFRDSSLRIARRRHGDASISVPPLRSTPPFYSRFRQLFSPCAFLRFSSLLTSAVPTLSPTPLPTLTYGGQD